MEIVRIAGVGLIGAVISILIRRARPEFSMMIPVVISFTIMAAAAPYLRDVIGELASLSAGVGINGDYMAVIVKIIGVSYLASISAELCRDAGEKAIAAKIELGGKLMILAMSVPLITRMLDLVREIMRI